MLKEAQLDNKLSNIMKNNIYNIIDKSKLDIVSEAIEKAHGLPNECYLGGAYSSIERKKNI